MKIRNKDKEIFKHDLNYILEIMKKIEQVNTKDRNYLIISILLLIYLLSLEYDLPFFLHNLSELNGFLIMVTTLFLISYPFRKYHEGKKVRKEIESFKERWGDYPNVLKYEKKEIVYDEDELITWSVIEPKTIFSEKKDRYSITVTLQPKNQCIIVHFIKNSKNQILYLLPSTGLYKNQIQRLEESFKYSELDDLIPDRINQKLTTIFPDCTIFKKIVDRDFDFNKENTQSKSHTNESELIFEDLTGLDKRWVYLKRYSNGNWRIHEHNTGPIGEQMFGKEDNEWWIDISNENIFKVFSLISKHSFTDNTDHQSLTLSKLKTILSENEVPFESGTW